MATLMRAGAQMLGASGSRAAQLEDWLLLAGSAGEVDEATNAFYRWYQLNYSKLDEATNQPLFRIRQELAGELPLYVAGLMSDFAKYVDELVAVAINLQEAITVIERRGWGQGVSFNRNTGQVCLLGAIDSAIFHSRKAPIAHYDRQFNLAASSISIQLGQRNIVDWNDTPGRSVDEVFSLLRATIDMVLSVK